MSDTLRWKIPGEIFEDGTKLTDWRKIESSHWQWAVFMGIIVALSYLSQTRPLYRGILLEVEPTADQTQ